MALDQREITKLFDGLRAVSETTAGKDAPHEDREKIKAIANAALIIGESIVLDLNRIAVALERLADTEK